jgi:hypothetical protein
MYKEVHLSSKIPRVTEDSEELGLYYKITRPELTRVKKKRLVIKIVKLVIKISTIRNR